MRRVGHRILPERREFGGVEGVEVEDVVPETKMCERLRCVLQIGLHHACVQRVNDPIPNQNKQRPKGCGGVLTFYSC